MSTAPGCSDLSLSNSWWREERGRERGRRGKRERGEGGERERGDKKEKMEKKREWRKKKYYT